MVYLKYFFTSVAIFFSLYCKILYWHVWGYWDRVRGCYIPQQLRQELPVNNSLPHNPFYPFYQRLSNLTQFTEQTPVKANFFLQG